MRSKKGRWGAGRYPALGVMLHGRSWGRLFEIIFPTICVAIVPLPLPCLFHSILTYFCFLVPMPIPTKLLPLVVLILCTYNIINRVFAVTDRLILFKLLLWCMPINHICLVLCVFTRHQVHCLWGVMNWYLPFIEDPTVRGLCTLSTFILILGKD